MEAVAKHDFTATQEDELGFKRNDVLKIIDKEDQNWYKAEMKGRTGMIPANYIIMKDHSWFKGNIPRQEAERLLAKEHDGAYLVRESESTPGEWSLSVKSTTGVQHYRIFHDDNGEYYLWVVKFDSINSLLDYHHSHSVSRNEVIVLQEKNTAFQSSGTPRGPKVIAQFDFRPELQEELALRKGDEIEILDKADPNWWRGRNLGTQKEGLFPTNYVKEL